MLVVAGERCRPPGEGRYQQMEIDYGPFERRISLDEPVDTAAATARYEHGMLTIELPIVETAPQQTRVAIVVGTRGATRESATSVEEQLEQGDVEIPAVLPVLPLKETVVFPESMIAARDRPGALGQARRRRDRGRAAARARHGQERGRRPAGWDDLNEVGTAAIVHKMIRVPDGTLRILVQGIERIRLERPVQDEPYLVGRVQRRSRTWSRRAPRSRRSPAASRPCSAG